MTLPPAHEILRRHGIRFVIGKNEFAANCPKCGDQTSNWVELHDDAVCCHCQNQNCDFAKIIPLAAASARPAAAASDGKAPNAGTQAAEDAEAKRAREHAEARKEFSDDTEDEKGADTQLEDEDELGPKAEPDHDGAGRTDGGQQSGRQQGKQGGQQQGATGQAGQGAAGQTGQQRGEQVFDPWAQYIVPPFPFDVLPPLVQDHVGAQAATIGCDPSALAMCALGTFSGALHHGMALKMMHYGTWYASPRLWVLLVGEVSKRKTPIMQSATSPVVHYEAHLRDKHEHDVRDYALALKEQSGDHASKPEAPEDPPRYVVRDTTVEKLGELLARGDGKKGVLVLADEVSGWLASMERYAHGGGARRSDRAFWLIAYDGLPHSVDRINRGELFIKKLSVSLIGGIQPVLLAEHKLLGLTSDGLLQRFLPVIMGGASLPQDRPSDDEKYNALVREMIFAKPARLIMTDEALAVMEDLRAYLFHLEQASDGGFQGFVGKLQGVAGSLALILHLAHEAQLGTTVPVEVHTVENTRRLVRNFIIPHAHEFYCGGTTADGERLRRIASWILTSGKTRIVASDLTTNVADCRGLTLFEVNQRASPLVAAGWLAPEDKTPVCRAWKVAPKLRTALADRARMEEARKAALSALIAARRKASP